MKIYEEAKDIKNDIIRARRYLHENAEIGIELPKATAFVIDELKSMGYDPKEICKSGVLATVGGKKPGKTFLIRADMDALPMQEETELSFKSTTGYMHSCGHDTHTAMLLGAAKILKQHEDEIEGTIKLMFQPDEEGGSGARSMIEAGVLENPTVDAALMIHIGAISPIPNMESTTSVLLTHGRMASSDRFKIVITGKGGHGSTPELSIDPINIGMHIGLALQTINSRELSGTDVAVLTLGRFSAGDAPNIIPDKAILEGTIRTLDNDVREKVNRRLKEIAESTATMFGGSALVTSTGISVLTQSHELVDDVASYIKDFFPKELVIVVNQNIMGSEDFSEVCKLVPGVIVGLSAPKPEKESHLPQHHPKIDFDEDAFPLGSAIYAKCAMDWLKKHK